MLYRVYTRCSRLNATKQIHTSPSSYVYQKLRPVPQRSSRPSAAKKEVEEEVVVAEPYSGYPVLLPKCCL